MDRLDKVFEQTPREQFLPRDAAAYAGLDVPLSIGFGQTNSQPSTVRMMLEWLEPQLGDKILDVGSGSGWTTALLAKLAGPQGRVYAVEVIPELVEFGRQNCARLDIENTSFLRAGKDLGLPKFGPYERILVSAAAQELPEELLDQIGVGGKLVIPVGHDILEIDKTSSKDYETVIHPGFVFVPLV